MPMDEQYWPNPHRAHAALHEQGPVSRVCLPDQVPVWFVTGYEQVRVGLWDQRLARQRKYAGPDFTTTCYPEGQLESKLIMEDPPEHTATRDLLNFAFTPRRIEAVTPKIREIVARLLDDVEREAAANGGDVDLMRSFYAPLPISVISGILGLPDEYFDRIMAVTTAEFAMADVQTGADDDFEPLGNAAETAQAELFQIIAALVEQRRAAPGDDLISHWATATDENGELLSIYDVVALVIIMYLGGYDTTAGMLLSSTVDLLEHPEELAKLRDNPELYPVAIDELLRRNSSVTRGFRRFATEDMELGGARIAAGDTVLLSINGANRDPEVFENPHALDFSRPNNQRHIAFGRGPHHCPGSSLATAEVTIALEALFARFPNLELRTTREEIPWRQSTFCRAAYSLPVNIGTPAGDA
ncbi:cytochrome P450 [Actinophytocola oryzae]|nr:cytochrome P450 [Actinophytocola oryzae]